jgi:hypothetical protein
VLSVRKLCVLEVLHLFGRQINDALAILVAHVLFPAQEYAF